MGVQAERGERMQSYGTMWRGAILWWGIIVLLIAFWAGVGYGLHDAFAGGSKPSHVVCTESKSRPYIGSAIVCTRQP